MLTSSRLLAARRQGGLTLIEVMIAVLVLSVGLLGTAALQGVTLQNSRSANYRSQATNLAYELMDSIRGTRKSMSGYASSLSAWTDTCAADIGEATPAVCTGTGVNPMTCDLARFRDRLCRELPNGRARMVSSFGPISGTTAVGGAYQVEICWADDIRTYTASGDCTGAGETKFSVGSNL